MSLKKGPLFEKMLHIKTIILKNHLVLLSIFLVKLSNVAGFDWILLSVDIGDFLQISRFENLQKRIIFHS